MRYHARGPEEPEQANDLRGAWRATVKASAAASKIRKNGEWKRPRCERRLEERIPRSRLPARSKSGTTARSPALIGMAHRGKIATNRRERSAGNAKAAATTKWVVVEATYGWTRLATAVWRLKGISITTSTSTGIPSRVAGLNSQD